MQALLHAGKGKQASLQAGRQASKQEKSKQESKQASKWVGQKLSKRKPPALPPSPSISLPPYPSLPHWDDVFGPGPDTKTQLRLTRRLRKIAQEPRTTKEIECKVMQVHSFHQFSHARIQAHICECAWCLQRKAPTLQHDHFTKRLQQAFQNKYEWTTECV